MKKLTLQQWLGDTQQRVMTGIVNRTCKRNPNTVDRMAMWLLKRIVGEVPDDPELHHPESD